MIQTKASTKYSSVQLSAFFGLNRKIKSKSGEFSDMMNLGHGEYPCLLSIPEKASYCSAPSGYTIEKLMFPVYGTVTANTFSGIAKKTSNDTYSIFINGIEKKSGITSYSDAVDYNGAILTIPRLVGFNYYTTSTSSTDTDLSKFIYTNESVQLKTTHASKPNQNTNYLKIEAETKFEVGQMIALSGFDSTTEYNRNNTFVPASSLDYSVDNRPTTIIITDIEHEYNTSSSSEQYTEYKVDLLNVRGKKLAFYTGVNDGSYQNFTGITIEAFAPNADYGTIYQNKLWLCGHSGESIFASSVGKPFDFYNSTLSSGGSWTTDIGSPGEFTGILALSNKLLAFKKEYLHVIYGDTPKTYSTEKTYTTGCIDRRSVARVGSYVIWLYHDGFYALSNGAPTKISECLNTNYESAIAFSDHKRYFARCKVKGENRYEFLVYDTEYGTWTKLTDSAIIGGCTYNGEPYVYTDSAVYKLFGGSYEDFYAETNELTFDSFMDKSAIDIYVRCRISSEGMAQNETAFLNVNTYVSGECFKHKAITTSGKHRLPIRCHPGDTLKLRFEGRGKVLIEDVEIKLEILENE